MAAASVDGAFLARVPRLETFRGLPRQPARASKQAARPRSRSIRGRPGAARLAAPGMHPAMRTLASGRHVSGCGLPVVWLGGCSLQDDSSDSIVIKRSACLKPMLMAILVPLDLAIDHGSH